MARPTKQGLDYFSFDVDFYDNRKIRKIMRACGPGAGSVLTCLLCSIYQGKGYYIVWDQDLPFDIADKLGMSEGPVTEVINKAVQVDFFDEHQFKANHILTSEEIQRRYKAGTAKRHEILLEPKFIVTAEKKRVNGVNNPVIDGSNGQSKVKESKEKDSKGNQKPKGFVGDVADPTHRELKKEYSEFVNSLGGKNQGEVFLELKKFIEERSPKFLEPYMDIWNVFALHYRLIKNPCQITDARRKKFNTRVGEASFDFLKILEKIKSSRFLKGDNNRQWKVGIEFILESEENYVKILEEKYDR